MKVSLSSRLLSDKNKVWSVLITDDDGQTAELHCLDERRARMMQSAICDAIKMGCGRE